jgi:hypothetical protein
MVIKIICSFGFVKIKNTMIKSTLFTLLILLAVLISNAQQSINLVNGKKVPISRFTVDQEGYLEGDGILYYTKPNGKTKKALLSDVFSVTLQNGNDSIFYRPDAEYGEYLSIEQMQQYVNGLNIAREKYKSQGSFWLGVGFGAVGGITPPLRFGIGEASNQIRISIAVPVAYTIIAGNSTMKTGNIESAFNIDPNNEYLVQGIKEGVRKKRLRNSAIGSIIGFGIGFLALAAIGG